MLLKEMTEKRLKELYEELKKKFKEYQDMNLDLNMARGKPCKKQLDLTSELFKDVDIYENSTDRDGVDCRNYGELHGIREIKELLSPLIGAPTDQIIIGGNASLNLMYDTMLRAVVYGVGEDKKPWGTGKNIKFLCPSPGYDRHFGICEILGFEMITVDMTESGPDMDKVEELAASDEAIKGIWCVPTYSNPTGVFFSDETVKRLANMTTKADDFRIFWDNAYPVHFLEEYEKPVLSILEECKSAGNPDRAYVFSSTSKITFPGAGISLMASSKDNIDYITKSLSKQTIGPNKMNQLLHVRAFKTFDNIISHMKKHAEILKPKFEVVIKTLNEELKQLGIAKWNNPKGGYFISLNTMEGCAKDVVKKADMAGVKLTNAGATYPLGKDPNDSNIRIAPSFPPIEELEIAINVLCTCIKLVSVEKLLNEKG